MISYILISSLIATITVATQSPTAQEQSIDQLFATAQSYQSQKSYNDAIALWKQIMAIDTNNTAACIKLAQAYVYTNQLSLAVKTIKNCQRIDPNLNKEDVYITYGDIYYAQNNSQTAKLMYKLALNGKLSNNISFSMSYIDILMSIENYQQAFDHLLTIINSLSIKTSKKFWFDNDFEHYIGTQLLKSRPEQTNAKQQKEAINVPLNVNVDIILKAYQLFGECVTKLQKWGSKGDYAKFFKYAANLAAFQLFYDGDDVPTTTAMNSDGLMKYYIREKYNQAMCLFHATSYQASLKIVQSLSLFSIDVMHSLDLVQPINFLEEACASMINVTQPNTNTFETFRLLHRVLELMPQFLQGWKQLGLLSMIEQKWESAIHSYYQAYMLDNNDLDTIIKLGDITKILGKFKIAIVFYKKALEIEPLNDYVLESIVDSLMRKRKNYAMAMQHIDTCCYVRTHRFNDQPNTKNMIELIQCLDITIDLAEKMNDYNKLTMAQAQKQLIVSEAVVNT